MKSIQTLDVTSSKFVILVGQVVRVPPISGPRRVCRKLDKCHMAWIVVLATDWVGHDK